MKILLLVDIQNDFCPGGALAVPKGDEVVAVANALMRSGAYDYVMATKDWHPPGHLSFASNHPGRNVFERTMVDGLEQTLWPIHCVQNTLGAEFHPGLSTKLIEKVVLKGTHLTVDSYSGFFDNAKRNATGLGQFLDELARCQGKTLKEIELHICGLATDYCVAATAHDARELGINTSIIVDGCRAVDLNQNDGLHALRKLADAGIAVISSQEAMLVKGREVSLQRERGQGIMRH